jgi:hypothetical protein
VVVNKLEEMKSPKEAAGKESHLNYPIFPTVKGEWITSRFPRTVFPTVERRQLKCHSSHLSLLWYKLRIILGTYSRVLP